MSVGTDRERGSEVGATRQERYLVVSIDSHVSPTYAQLREYCPPKYLSEFDQWSAQWYGYWGQERNWYGPGSPVAARWNFPFTDVVRARTGECVERAGAGVCEPGARLKDMDADGIAAEMLYHTAFTREIFPFERGTVLSPTASGGELELYAAGCQMYNRWLADFVSEAPDRFIGAAYLPIWDVDACVREVEWARNHGIRCVNFPAPQRSFPDYNDPVYEPFWAACEMLEMPLTTHGGAGDMPEYKGREAWALYCSDLFYYSRRGFMYMVWAGVFERHPGLKLVFTEQRCNWVKDTLEELDSVYHSSFQDLTQLIPRPPSDYFRTNCYLGVSFMSRFEAERRHDVGVDRLMWGSDYPHFEGTWGFTDLHLRHTFHGIPVDEVRAILGENALGCFGLDRSKLREIADVIGPSPDDVDTPIDQVPDVPGQAFRVHGSWS